MIFVQNKCLQWIQNHHKPLVGPFIYPYMLLEAHVFLCILPYTVKSMGPKLSSVITVIKLPDWQGYRTKV